MSESLARPGEQLASSVCATRVVVVRVPAEPPTIACGGAPMVPLADAEATSQSGAPRTILGKRYVDESGAVELLCTRPGSGELTCDGVLMTVKAAKPLPASD